MRFSGFITMLKSEKRVEKKNQIAWFVMRFARRNQYNSEKVQLVLEAMRQRGIEVFRPMHEQLCQRGGKLGKHLLPVMGDLFFAKASQSDIEAFIQEVNGQVQFKFKCSGYHQLMIVPFAEMENFMLAMHELSLKHYYQPEEFRKIKAGSRVRVHASPDNPSHGVEGVLARPKGSRNRCFLVEVPGYLCASFEVHPEWLEVIEEQ